MKYRPFAAALLSAVLLTGCGEASQAQSDALYAADLFAMDTYMNLKAYGSNAEAAVQEAEERIQTLEHTLSVTDHGSDLYALNHAEGTAVNISDDTRNILDTAAKIGKESGGALCISLYPVLRTWGFTTGEYRVPADSELADLLQLCDDSLIAVSGNAVTLPPQTEIDLGAVAKGYTGDAVMEIYKQHGVTAGIISLGGNVQALGKKPDGSAWTVGVTDPFAPDQLLGTVTVTDKAVITSGNYERYFTGEDGQRYWHILDPATGRPAKNGLVSVTVIGDCGAECDALSTALFVEGTEQAAAHWRRAGGFEMILVTEDGEVLLTEGIAADFQPKREVQSRVIGHDEES